jgi:hypothetical protein
VRILRCFGFLGLAWVDRFFSCFRVQSFRFAPSPNPRAQVSRISYRTGRKSDPGLIYLRRSGRSWAPASRSPVAKVTPSSKVQFVRSSASCSMRFGATCPPEAFDAGRYDWHPQEEKSGVWSGCFSSPRFVGLLPRGVPLYFANARSRVIGACASIRIVGASSDLLIFSTIRFPRRSRT